jgi:enoyl-CoA hydratase/carnithine racemase
LHGYTVGTGLLMSLACDIRIAAEGARLGVSEVRLGFLAGSGGTQRLPRLIGIPKALEICLSGELYDAAECYRIGLVNQLVPYDQLIPAGEKMAQSFLKGAPLALLSGDLQGSGERWSKPPTVGSPEYGLADRGRRKGRAPSSKTAAELEEDKSVSGFSAFRVNAGKYRNRNRVKLLSFDSDAL